MNLYIINCEITNTSARYLLKHLHLYNDQPCDIVEIINSTSQNVQNIKSGYLSKLTIGKLKYQLNNGLKRSYHQNDFDVIYYLIQTQQINYKDIIYRIRLNNAYKCLQVLIEQGINVNIPDDDDGETPLHKACSFNNVESIKLLLDQGADVNIQHNYGYTPLYTACSNNSVESVKLLILNGANVNIPDNYGRTPLHLACRYNSVEIVKLLLYNGANVNIQDNKGFTPLHLACFSNSVGSVKLLLLNGANVNSQNNDGETPLQIAQNNSSKDCIKLLQGLYN